MPIIYKRRLLFASFLLIFSLILYGLFVEPNHVVLKKVTIKDDVLFRAWGRVKILQLSDLHITRLGKREEDVIQKIAAIYPDIVCVTGDLAQWGSSYSEVVRFLKAIKSRYGVYVVLGDSDMSTGRVRCFFCHQAGSIHLIRKHPVFLRNNLVNVKTEGGRNIRILGISPDMKAEEFSSFWEGIRRADSKDEALLVLSHFSCLWKLLPASEKVLWLSGDTHGGQIWFPRFLRPLIFHGKDYEHLKGLFHSGKNKWLYVNQGLGVTAEFPFRIGVPPEITVITFGPGH